MPLQNRVTPQGQLTAVPARGTLMGNRGVLHDAQQRIVRHHRGRRWISCLLSFKGRHRPVMAPNRYTELFFLDEPTALAAGHRPCAECRRDDFNAFKAAWQAAGLTPASKLTVDIIDRHLHAERWDGRRQRLHRAMLDTLPDGTFLQEVGHVIPQLLYNNQLWPWRPDGYGTPLMLGDNRPVTLITPPALVAVLRQGYRPQPHSSLTPSTS